MAGMSDENQSHREDTATAEDADHGTEEAKPPGSPFFLLFSVLSVSPMPNLAVTQLTEEPEKRSCWVSPIVTQSKSEEGQGVDLRAHHGQHMLQQSNHICQRII